MQSVIEEFRKLINSINEYANEGKPPVDLTFNCFPNPLPDECLYSLMCRYHIISGNESTIDSLGQFIGNRYNWPVSFISRGILHKVACALGMAKKEVEDRYTLSSVSLWLGHGDISLMRGFVFEEDFLLELFPCLIAPRQYHQHYNRDRLKICPECYIEDLTIYSFPYWHLSHQPQYVTACYKHNVPLVHGCHVHSNLFPCDELQLPKRECNTCAYDDDLANEQPLSLERDAITTPATKPVSIGIDNSIAKLVDCIINLHCRPPPCWHPIIGCQRIATYVGLTASALRNDSSDFRKFETRTKHSIERVVAMGSTWNNSSINVKYVHGFYNRHIFEHFESWYFEHLFIDYDGSKLTDDDNCPEWDTQHTLWLLAYAVDCGIEPAKVIAIYMHGFQ